MLPDFSLGADEPQIPDVPKVHYRDLGTKLSDLTLDKELFIQYSMAVRMMTGVENDSTIPLNQKAQLLNTITAVLSQIVKTQAELYNAENFKKLEQSLIEALKKFPDINAEFWAHYESLNDET